MFTLSDHFMTIKKCHKNHIAATQEFAVAKFVTRINYRYICESSSPLDCSCIGRKYGGGGFIVKYVENNERKLSHVANLITGACG